MGKGVEWRGPGEGGSSPMSNTSAGPCRELIEKPTFKCWQKGSYTWHKFTKSSEKPEPQHALWNSAIKALNSLHGPQNRTRATLIPDGPSSHPSSQYNRYHISVQSIPGMCFAAFDPALHTINVYATTTWYSRPTRPSYDNSGTVRRSNGSNGSKRQWSKGIWSKRRTDSAVSDAEILRYQALRFC
eukprot:1558664-Rhodomonas_salina.9